MYNVNHGTHMKVIRSRTFDRWLDTLRDPGWRIRIAVRLGVIESEGHFGDTKYLRDGVWELRFKSGAGFRVYYLRHGQTVVVLLCGGDKSTQRRDIEKALDLAAQFKAQEPVCNAPTAKGTTHERNV